MLTGAEIINYTPVNGEKNYTDNRETKFKRKEESVILMEKS